jgi:hypothetical protein
MDILDFLCEYIDVLLIASVQNRLQIWNNVGRGIAVWNSGSQAEFLSMEIFVQLVGPSFWEAL